MDKTYTSIGMSGTEEKTRCAMGYSQHNVLSLSTTTPGRVSFIPAPVTHLSPGQFFRAHSSTVERGGCHRNSGSTPVRPILSTSDGRQGRAWQQGLVGLNPLSLREMKRASKPVVALMPVSPSKRTDPLRVTALADSLAFHRPTFERTFVGAPAILHTIARKSANL